MNVYLLTRRGTLHKVVQTETGLLTFEADNIDSARAEVYSEIFKVPQEAVKRWCKRCWPNGPLSR